jgi:hypothetical protein
MIMPKLFSDFTYEMLKELANNEHKGDFDVWQPTKGELLEEINYHFQKFASALLHNQDDKVTEYAADLANYYLKAYSMYGKKTDFSSLNLNIPPSPPGFNEPIEYVPIYDEMEKSDLPPKDYLEKRIGNKQEEPLADSIYRALESVMKAPKPDTLKNPRPICIYHWKTEKDNHGREVSRLVCDYCGRLAPDTEDTKRECTEYLD